MKLSRFRCGLLWMCALITLTLQAASPAPLVSVPRFTHPGAGQVFYFLLTDRFANGSSTNDTGGFTGGPDQSGFDPTRISHYHGGDLAGLISKLDYIKQLGATAIWLTPPFRNKPMQTGTAGYHGYWILDFLHIDPHLGTDAEFKEFVTQAHARGLKVYLDIVINHTADVIQLQSDYTYRDRASAPYRDANGKAFDERTVAYNGLNDPDAFPPLSAKRSFPYIPTVPSAEAHAKNPEWLNDVTLYHNRGNSTFQGENSLYGDFVGLDDVFTENPKVVEGFIAIFGHWLRDYHVDGFRIDTARHVNAEFWQAFIPAIRAEARKIDRPDFLEFGEVANEAGDPAVLSEFSTAIPLDATLDFGFFVAARKFVSQTGPATALNNFFGNDDYYTDHDSNVHSTTTFLSNHDAGRFAYFLQQDNSGATQSQLADLVRLAHGLLYLVRGQPVVYYGDEQGMIGRGGNDMQAREDMFAAQAPDFKTALLLGTTRTGADDKFDGHHPFYQLLSRLGALRSENPALRTGAMIPRETHESGLFAFSRIGRGQRVEYLIVLNNSRTASLSSLVPTSQAGGAHLKQIFCSCPMTEPSGDALTTNTRGEVQVTLAPLQFAVWKAETSLDTTTSPTKISFLTPATGASLAFTSREVDGQVFPSRQELRAEVAGGDGFAEVTFSMIRASRPNQYELIGTDDTVPYRVFWRPPADLAPDETLTFFATVDDLRGHRLSTQIEGVKIKNSSISFGTKGAVVPFLTRFPEPEMPAQEGRELNLVASAGGTQPLEYQWLHDGLEIDGATQPTLTIPSVTSESAGRYGVLVRNREGTCISRETLVIVAAREK